MVLTNRKHKESMVTTNQWEQWLDVESMVHDSQFLKWDWQSKALKRLCLDEKHQPKASFLPKFVIDYGVANRFEPIASGASPQPSLGQQILCSIDNIPQADGVLLFLWSR
jgi:hypothetical protein